MALWVKAVMPTVRRLGHQLEDGPGRGVGLAGPGWTLHREIGLVEVGHEAHRGVERGLAVVLQRRIGRRLGPQARRPASEQLARRHGRSGTVDAVIEQRLGDSLQRRLLPGGTAADRPA